MKALKDALSGDDLDAAKDAYATVTALQESQEGAGTSTPAFQDMVDMLAEVGSALDVGDLGAAQSAFAAGAPKGPPPPPPPPPSADLSEEESDALSSLAEALQSDDLASAQDAYTALLALLDSRQAEIEEENQAASTADSLRDRLEDLGTALAAGSVEAAQQEFASLAPRGMRGIDVLA
ncbi:hypothetical protein [Roseospira visakhapatnamensis]|uniref:Molecular chaperone DnaK (HSP70) n=1 Tax=Roseospira visakhapatnamensis TaxID=390880 RepID=A0A7W6RA07_9PROT|nr:hypothetical protein [Roseospira visakhapatnamensis]MBB4264700.1 molecular chaperone DnaK (HSP70) [Roseospira visakhapatnamensis]